MKKLILKLCFAVMAVAFMSGAAFAEFNMRVSIDTPGTYTAKKNNVTKAYDFDSYVSATFSGDYMKRVAGQYLSLGGGFEISIPKVYEYTKIDDEAFWFLPVYFSIQTNPIPDIGLFLKANLGYNVIFLDSAYSNHYSVTFKGGLYYALAAGYEFPFGLIADITYAVYNGTAESKYSLLSPVYERDYVYTRIAASIGYKFGRPRR